MQLWKERVWEVKDGIFSWVTVFYYCKSISTSHSVCKQPIKKNLGAIKMYIFVWDKCMFKNICMKNKKIEIIMYISYSFFVSTNNHFIFSLCIFLISLRHSGRYFFSFPIRKGRGLKGGGVCLQSHSRSRGSLLLGFWYWRAFEVFWILLTRWSWLIAASPLSCSHTALQGTYLLHFLE